MDTIELRASSLPSKWGFGDGDVINDILFDAGLYDTPMPEGAHISFAHEVLARCVETHLLPLVPRVVTFRIGTIHNPIRTQSELTDAEEAASVEITRDQVIEMARAVAAEMSANQ